MPGPYTAFTYGDPASITSYPNNPTIRTVEKLVFGLPLGPSYNPSPVAIQLQGGVIGTAYSETISSSGGSSPYTFSVYTGSLPPGLSLNSSTGVISGTPTSAATYNFTIKVVDAVGNTGTQAFSIAIAASGGGSAPSNYGYVG